MMHFLIIPKLCCYLPILTSWAASKLTLKCKISSRDHELALDNYQSALSVHESLENILGQARTHTNIGSVLVRLGKRDDALESLYRARGLYVSIKAQGRLVDTVEQVISQIEEKN